MSNINDLASELLLQIFRSCTSISDVVNLSLTCRRMHTLLPASQKLPILFLAAEAEFGPLHDAIRLATFIRHAPINVVHDPPLSYQLLRQVVFAGRIAERWTEIYQLQKWAGEENFVSRRSLSSDERYRIRRAVYRYWLYTQAFHNADCLRTMRMFPTFVADRCSMLRQWSNAELFEIEDVRMIFRGLLAEQLCPSNGMVLQRRDNLHCFNGGFRDRGCYGSAAQGSAVVDAMFYSAREQRSLVTSTSSPARRSPSPKSQDTANRVLYMEGFGDEIEHYHFIETMLKLDPAQVLQLYDNVVYKWQVEEYVSSMGEWFPNNGQTWSSTWNTVITQRGFDVEEIRGAIEDGRLGVAVEKTTSAVLWQAISSGEGGW